MPYCMYWYLILYCSFHHYALILVLGNIVVGSILLLKCMDAILYFNMDYMYVKCLDLFIVKYAI